MVALRWIRLSVNFCLFVTLLLGVWHYQLFIYLIYQGKGQLHILSNTVSVSEYLVQDSIPDRIRENINLVERIKKYSIDTLDYKPTDNFNTIYDQKNAPVLWVITVSEPYEIKPYEWQFPIIGSVSYKGFFKKDLAEKEYNHFVANGYDVDLRSVSAWSTLGWFKDPLLTNTLKGSKGRVCNLLFHELFHATYYAPNSVNFNENIASFIAHKATLQFLATDTMALKEYLFNYTEHKHYNDFVLRQKERLKKELEKIKTDPNRYVLKLKLINTVVDSLTKLKPFNDKLFELRKNEILKQKNAYFIDFEQYDSMQDSLEEVFNKFYKGDLKKMVRDLRLKGSNS